MLFSVKETKIEEAPEERGGEKGRGVKVRKLNTSNAHNNKKKKTMIRKNNIRNISNDVK